MEDPADVALWGCPLTPAPPGTGMPEGAALGRSRSSARGADSDQASRDGCIRCPRQRNLVVPTASLRPVRDFMSAYRRAAAPEEAQRIGHADDGNHCEHQCKFPVALHSTCGNPLLKG